MKEIKGKLELKGPNTKIGRKYSFKKCEKDNNNWEKNILFGGDAERGEYEFQTNS
jgi:hypothetical protein